MDGWSNPANESIWNFVINTSDHREYLWSLRNLSHQHHTADFLAEQIEEIIDKIEVSKFSTIISNAGANIRLAHHHIIEKYPYILNIKCIAHAINLISKDIYKTLFANKILN